MLRQLQRLTRAVPAAGPAASAIAVYAEAESAESGEPDHQRVARERGTEGVACVDDAARAIVLYCAIWDRSRLPFARTAAHSLLQFLAFMQDEDGRFTNFILDWTGRRNRTGSTSYPGGPQWQARALHALACATASFGGDEWNERFGRGLRWVDTVRYLDVRAVCVLAALKHWQATGATSSAERALAWSAEIAAQRDPNGILLNASGVRTVHWWGHLQEAALADAGRLLSQPALAQCARESADALLLPAAAQCSILDSLLPFDVSCIVSGLAAVAQASGDARYHDAASRARDWFFGRNSAGQPVYDREHGRVYDGIDTARVSRNSGAESNIEGALAIIDLATPSRVCGLQAGEGTLVSLSNVGRKR